MTAAFADLRLETARQTEAAEALFALGFSGKVREPIAAFAEMVAVLRRHSGSALVVGAVLLCGIGLSCLQETG